MKRYIYFIILIGLIASGCADLSNPDMNDNQQSGEGTVEYRYLRINIASSSKEGVRSDFNDYVDGDEAESTIGNIRFYFFDDSGNPVAVASNSETGEKESFIERTLAELSAGSSSNETGIESEYTVVLPLELSGGNPTRLIAVANPTSTIISMTMPTLKELQDDVEDFQTGLTSSNFVMSNSSYMEEKGGIKRIISPVEMSASNLTTDLNGDRQNSVTIYIERVVARLDLNLGSSMNPVNINGLENVYQLNATNPENEENGVYVQLLGWAVTSTPTVSRLLKSIEPGWEESGLFSDSKPWNMESAHRSFWAINPKDEDLDYQWYSFNDISGKGSNKERAAGCFAFSETNKTYLQENANPYSESPVEAANAQYPTKLIIAAQLIDRNGSPVSLAEYAGKYFTPKGLIDFVADNLDMHTPISAAEGTGYTKIMPADLKFETFLEHNPESVGQDAQGTYYVYITLSDIGEGKEWYHKPTVTDGEYVLIEDPLNYLDETLYPAKVWENGLTYYFKEITHYGLTDEDPISFGVIRNSIYNVTITGISNLGVPVYNPEEVIYPELPDPQYNPFEAIINVALWRINRENIQVTW